MTTVTRVSRRRFLQGSAALSGALVVGFHWPEAQASEKAAETAAGEVNAWVVIHPDESVVIRVARSEMGQGSFTGLPMLVAEELECDWSKVRAEFAPPAEHLRRNRVWGGMGTGGSSSIRGSQEMLRKAGATAREMLIAAAAKRWDVPAAECHAERGRVLHAGSQRKLSFGQLAGDAAKLTPPAEVKLKDPSQWKLLGTSPKRLENPDKVVGAPMFGIDVQLPGLKHAAIRQCPVFGGRVKSFDGAEAEKMRGVAKVLSLGDAVVVVADNWWRAQRALDQVKIEWDEKGNGQLSSKSIRDDFRNGLANGPFTSARNMGDVDGIFQAGGKVLEAEYFAPYLNHATMEPQTCTALIKGERVEVWVPTQNGEGSLAAAAEAAGVPLPQVEVHKTHLGGGFGRRGAFQDYVRQAVKVAQALPGTPVKLLWSREEDMQHGYYRPASLVRMRAVLGADGKPAAWHTRIACPSILSKVRPEAVRDGLDSTSVVCFSDLPYAIPHQRVEYALRNTPVPVGFWRAVGHSQNPFFRECFLDEMAHAARVDPYEYRRSLLADKKKDLAVLEAAAKAAGWGKPLPAGVHRGIAVQDGYGSYAAAVIEVSVSPKGELKIHRVVVAVDSGHVVHADAAKAQIESCVIYGLTAALYGENTLKDGRIEQSNFHDYPLMRLAESPKVESVLVPSGGFWGGFGEPPLMPLAPALCNAIFAATGKRVRSLPLRGQALRSV